MRTVVTEFDQNSVVAADVKCPYCGADNALTWLNISWFTCVWYKERVKGHCEHFDLARLKDGNVFFVG